MKKNFNNSVSGYVPTDEDMKLINEFALKEMKSDDVFCFNLMLCDNEIDRDTERFDISALNKLAKLFVGKTGIFDHSMSSKNQIARIFEAHTEQKSGVKTSVGENYTFLKAKAYIPRTDANNSLIGEIEAGIKKEVSINCSVSKKLCSICSKDILSESCAHRKGKEYQGKICHHILSSPVDAYEWSFVAVPAQRKAGTVKSFKGKEIRTMEEILKSLSSADDNLNISAEEAQKIVRCINELNKLAEDGREYKSHLKKEIIKLSAIASPEISSKSIENICLNLDVTALNELMSDLKKANDKKCGFIPQLAKNPSVKSDSENNDFLI